jgi:hypothetical protein
MKSCNTSVSPAVLSPRMVGIWLGEPNMTSRMSRTPNRYSELEDHAKGLHPASVERGAIHEMVHECVEDDNADEDEGNQRKRLQ